MRIFPDHDECGQSLAAARDATRKWRAEGRTVRAAMSEMSATMPTTFGSPGLGNRNEQRERGEGDVTIPPSVPLLDGQSANSRVFGIDAEDPGKRFDAQPLKFGRRVARQRPFRLAGMTGRKTVGGPRGEGRRAYLKAGER